MSIHNFKPLQAQDFSLAGGGAVSGATTVILKSFKTIDGVNIAMSDLGTIGFMTLEPGSGALEEQISFTGVTQNTNGTATLTGVSSVLFVYPYTQSSGLSKTHAGSTTAVLSNTSGFYDQFVSKNDDATITGKYIFPSDDVSNAGIVADTDTAVATAFVTLGQLSRQAISGASNASTTVKGIVQLPTQAQTDAKTTTGSTGALLAITPDVMRSTKLSDYVADTGAADAYAIAPSPAITSYVVGQRFSFLVANTNVTTTPTLAVNALAGTLIFVRGGVAPAAGDIKAGMIIEVEKTLNNGFEMMVPVGNQSTPVGTMSMYAGSTAPDGWLLCDATSYLRADYAALFAVISTTYGSADGTHFNVPDMRGRVPVGVGTGTGGGAAGTGLPTGGSALTAVARATWKGEETHVLSITEMPSHDHTGSYFTTGGGSGISLPSNTGTATTLTVQPQGGGTAHNTIQPVMGVNFIIKT